jgi:hypothetical protein
VIDQVRDRREYLAAQASTRADALAARQPGVEGDQGASAAMPALPTPSAARGRRARAGDGVLATNAGVRSTPAFVAPTATGTRFSVSSASAPVARPYGATACPPRPGPLGRPDPPHACRSWSASPIATSTFATRWRSPGRASPAAAPVPFPARGGHAHPRARPRDGPPRHAWSTVTPWPTSSRLPTSWSRRSAACGATSQRPARSEQGPSSLCLTAGRISRPRRRPGRSRSARRNWCRLTGSNGVRTGPPDAILPRSCRASDVSPCERESERSRSRLPSSSPPGHLAGGTRRSRPVADRVTQLRHPRGPSWPRRADPPARRGRCQGALPVPPTSGASARPRG